MHAHNFVKKNLDSVYFKIIFNYEFYAFVFRVRGQYTIFLHSLPENGNFRLAHESFHLLAVVRNNNFLWGFTQQKSFFSLKIWTVRKKIFFILEVYPSQTLIKSKAKTRGLASGASRGEAL